MPNPIEGKILEQVRSETYRPLKPRQLAKTIAAADDDNYPHFRQALKSLMDEGRVALGTQGTVVMPTERRGKADEIVGTYRHNRKGFGFVIPTVAGSHEDLFIPEGNNPPGAITGDVVRAKVLSRGQRDGKSIANGKIVEVLERKNKRFVGSLQRAGQQWFVLPDGNTYTEPIYTPDAANKYIKPGTKVVVEITEFPTKDEAAMGVITDVLGKEGEKDVDLKTVVVQFNLPGEFPQEVKDQASAAVSNFKLDDAMPRRYNAMTDQIVCTIDPDDAKDYDDAISLTQLDDGLWELGVHIADVSYFVQEASALDVEAKERGNSTYFPGYVIPMLPEILSNGICSLQEGVPRLCKSAFITFDKDAKPVSTRFSNTVIKSAKRLRYREAQAILDGAHEIPHPDGPKTILDYDNEVVTLLHDMDDLAKRIQKRRRAAGQLSLELPKMELVLDENGKVKDAVPEDDSFTHTLIEMFMVEANEAVARLLDAIDAPFLRRTHPEPDTKASDRLRLFVGAAGHKIPDEFDRHAIQALLNKVKGKPEAFAINLAVLRSFTRAEYSPKPVGHFALASQHYCHFTSPIRRYADLTIHRLLDAYFEAVDADHSHGPAPRLKGRPRMENIPTFDDLMLLGRHISYTERRSEDAERELRQVKLLELMQNHIGEHFMGVVTGVTNFGIFIQIQQYMVEGLIRYTSLLDDWWDVDEKAGMIRGQRTGMRIRIGDVAKVAIVRVDVPRREMDLSVVELVGRGKAKHAGETGAPTGPRGGGKPKRGAPASPRAERPAHPIARKTEGTTKRNQRSKQRDRKKGRRSDA
jgi:ribonuclease R